MKRAFVLCFVSIFTLMPCAHAALILEENSSNLIRNNCVDGIKTDLCYHVFEGSDLHIYASKPLNSEHCKIEAAELFQISTEFQVPIKNAVKPISDEVCDQSKGFIVQVPKLRSATEFQIVVHYGDGNNTDTVGIKAYPRNLLDPVRQWAKYKENALIVFDRKGGLTEFLDKNKIKYTPYDLTKENLNKVYLYVGDENSLYPEDKYKKIVFFTEKNEGMPFVYVERDHYKTRAYAQIKILSAMNADNPLAQTIFLKLFDIITR